VTNASVQWRSLSDEVDSLQIPPGVTTPVVVKQNAPVPTFEGPLNRVREATAGRMTVGGDPRYEPARGNPPDHRQAL